ncbi:MAG: hypothetical protein A3E25_16010 [Burkholderiales bacterium RIFCSPHIGHO2_12_FULL_69_20]|nr:MAG: hypothetical protein A3E25_16010 [Burkholderiales bacterium RIFCSPHIGHO2_12_FULL_69_20]
MARRNRASASGPRAAASARLLAILAVIFGLVVLLVGLLALAAGMGLLPRAPSAAAAGNAGLAVVIGLCFTLAGAAMVLFAFARRAASMLALATLLCFVVAFNWVAFGPGERSFTQRTSVGRPIDANAARQPMAHAEGRGVLRAVALGLDAAVLAGVVLALRSRRSAAAAPPSGKPPPGGPPPGSPPHRQA